jgi:hypothetical protein
VAKNIAAGPGTPKEMASAEPKTGLRKSSQGYHYSLMEENSKISCFFLPSHKFSKEIFSEFVLFFGQKTLAI